MEVNNTREEKDQASSVIKKSLAAEDRHTSRT